MGLVLTIDFEGGERTIEIDGDKNIEFLDYDVVFDIAAHEFGYAETEEAKFYAAYKRDGIDPLFTSHRSWREALVDALHERAEECWDAGFEKEEFAKLLYHETISDEDNDYRDDIIELVGEDQLIDWLIDGISAKLEDKWADITYLTQLIEPYITKEDIDVEEDVGYDDNTESYENLKVGDYSVSIKGKEIIRWRIMAEYRIYDAVGFGGDVDLEFNEEGAEDKDSTMRSFLDTFDIKLGEFTDPDPPDHPETDEDGDFAVLYKLDSDHFGHGYEEDVLVPYKDVFDAGNAMELSESIFKRDGDEDYVEMAIMRRLTQEELDNRKLLEHEREMLKRQGALFDIEAEPEKEREAWESEWIPMTEEEIHAEKKKRYKWL